MYQNKNKIPEHLKVSEVTEISSRWGTPMLVRLLVRLNLTNMASHLVRQWDSW